MTAGDDPRRRLYRAALDLLARREHSRLELARKLRARSAVPGEVLAAVLDRLAAEGLQSDRRFAESFVRLRVGRGQGPCRIRAELRQRGVEEALIEDALATCEVDWVALASRALRSRFGEGAPRQARELARRIRFLRGRGFAEEQIRRALGDFPGAPAV
ncbi:MAG: regulatory protein RecX [Porticoccaceae bacterium]|nr:MAG: regulatory protein RecX [Porticoccaceae bacterium]